VAGLLELWPSHPLAQSRILSPVSAKPNLKLNRPESAQYFLVAIQNPKIFGFEETVLNRNHCFIEKIHYRSLNPPNLQSLQELRKYRKFRN
jgi:hypothetical protein